MADRILTTHAGSLPRPDELADMIWARMDGEDVDEARARGEDRRGGGRGRRQAARRRHRHVSDGEMSKTGFSTYVNERFSGFDGRSEFQADDVADFPDLAMRLFDTPPMAHLVLLQLRRTGGAHRQGRGASATSTGSRRALGDTDPRDARSWARSAPGRSPSTTPTSTTARTRSYLAALRRRARPTSTGRSPTPGSTSRSTRRTWRWRRTAARSGSSVGDWHHHLPLAVDALNAALERDPARAGPAPRVLGQLPAAPTTRTSRSRRSSARRSGSTPARSTSRAPIRATRTSGVCSRTSSCPTTSP